MSFWDIVLVVVLVPPPPPALVGAVVMFLAMVIGLGNRDYKTALPMVVAAVYIMAIVLFLAWLVWW